MKIKILIILLLFLFFSNISYCQNKGTNINPDINGVWQDINPGVQNAVVIISEQNGTVIFSHYLEWNGHKFIESGFGKRNGNYIEYKVNVTLPIDGWATEGTHFLTLSEDGNTLEGHYKDNKKREGPIAFKRIK